MPGQVRQLVSATPNRRYTLESCRTRHDLTHIRRHCRPCNRTQLEHFMTSDPSKRLAVDSPNDHGDHRNTNPKFATMIKILLAVSLSAFMAACSNQPPKCSDAATLTLVRNILIKNLTEFDGTLKDKFENSFEFKFPRATSHDDAIRKYSCETTVVAGKSLEMDFQYESQIDDSGNHLVILLGISKLKLNQLSDSLHQDDKKSNERDGNTLSNISENQKSGELSQRPSIRPETPYSEVREILIREGGKPATQQEADECSESDIRCQGRPEMQACSGAGMAPCIFAWEKNGTLAKVCTIGMETAFNGYCD
jgi:hypothetical protein